MIGVSMTFEDVTRAHGLRTELESAKRELETAYEELQSTVEELETTNEELQSTNEELETTNEELRERTDEAVGANTFLSSVLGSIPAAVVVLGPDLVVHVWSQAATELWGPRPDEAEGQFFLNLEIGLPSGELRDAARLALGGDSPEPVELRARDRRGRPVLAVSTFSPLRGLNGEIRGAILAMTAAPLEESR